MIKAKKFIPITEYHDQVNKQVRQHTGVDPIHAHDVPSLVPIVIERRPTTKTPIQPKQAGTIFKEYELFPTKNKNQYQLFPSNTANSRQPQPHQVNIQRQKVKK